MGKRSRWAHAMVALSAAAPASAAADLAVPPTVIGINLSAPDYYRRSRPFANLAMGTAWGARLPGQQKLGPDIVDRDGNLKRLPDGVPVERLMTQPNAGTRDATVRCTYDGRGEITATLKGARDVHKGAGFFTYRWRNDGYNNSLVVLKVTALDPANPIRNLDCREADLPRTARFDPQFVDFLKGFKIIRFMDWQATNRNEPITWATRHTPRSLDILQADGVAIEDMIELARETGAEPWFNMPWNADDDYVARFAQLVHDSLPRGRKVYVELGNEVWNARFPMSKQALAEGQAANLSPNGNTARLYRYARRLAHAMDIWAKVYADRPNDLVRVANCQNGPNFSNMVLGFEGTANHIDALATAPYFAQDFGHIPPADADAAFARMNDSMDRVLQGAMAAKGVAAKYHKRYIAYEAGQHIVLKDQALAEQIQRDPRMYDAYKRYLDLWRAQIGDTIMMYNSVQPIGRSGSWGLVEYLGQPAADAPKMRAVREAIQISGGRAH